MRIPERELRLGATLLFATAFGIALLVASLRPIPSVLAQGNQLHSELSHNARTSALIDSPTDVADGDLFNAPKREAKLGTVRSDDLFSAGMREAKAGEQKFEQAVAKEKEKAVKTELASLRKSLPKTKEPKSAVGRAQSEWTRLEATADRIAGEAAADEKQMASKRKAYSLQHASLSKLGLDEPELSQHAVRKGRISGSSLRRVKGRAQHKQQAVSGEQRTVTHEEREVRKIRAANARLRSELQGLRSGAVRKGKMTELSENDNLAIRHRQRVIHETRPGAVGGVSCAPPFCDAGSLPAVLPGDEP